MSRRHISEHLPVVYLFNPDFWYFKGICLRELHSTLLLAHITCRSSKLDEHKVEDNSSGRAQTEFRDERSASIFARALLERFVNFVPKFVMKALSRDCSRKGNHFYSCRKGNGQTALGQHTVLFLGRFSSNMIFFFNQFLAEKISLNLAENISLIDILIPLHFRTLKEKFAANCFFFMMWV